MSSDILYRTLLANALIMAMLSHFMTLIVAIIFLLLNWFNRYFCSVVFLVISALTGYLLEPITLPSPFTTSNFQHLERSEDRSESTTAFILRVAGVVIIMVGDKIKPVDTLPWLHECITYLIISCLAFCGNLMFICIIFCRRPDWWAVYLALLRNPDTTTNDDYPTEEDIWTWLVGYSGPGTIDPRILSLSNTDTASTVPISFESTQNYGSTSQDVLNTRDGELTSTQEFPFSSVRDLDLDGIYDHLPSSRNVPATGIHNSVSGATIVSSTNATANANQEPDPGPESFVEMDRLLQAWVPQTGLPGDAGGPSDADFEPYDWSRLASPDQEEIQGDDTQQFNAPKPTSPKNKFTVGHTCSECGKEFPNKSSKSHHILSHTKPFRCPESSCSARYATKTHLDRHVNVRHAVSKRFYCAIGRCKYSQGSRGGKFFKRMDHARRHARMRHNGSEKDIVTVSSVLPG